MTPRSPRLKPSAKVRRVSSLFCSVVIRMPPRLIRYFRPKRIRINCDTMRVSVQKVKPRPKRRPYDTSHRREAAAETRKAVVAAASKLFADRGYAATTMTAIAAAAGVALDTVYASVGPKPVLFRHLIETAISGRDQPAVAEDRGYVQRIRAEPDPGRTLALSAHALRA